MSNKTVLAIVGLMAACGCLSVIVLAVGAGAYFVLNEEFGFSDKEIGITLPDVPLNSPLEDWLSQPSTSEEGETTQADQQPELQAAQPEESNPPLPEGSPEAGNNEEARKACARFAPAFPQLELVTAFEYDGLTCGFAPKGTQHYAGLVNVTEYASAEEALSAWATDWGPSSQHASAVNGYVESYPDRYTYVREADRYFLAYHDTEAAAYTLTAGRQYEDAVIKYEYLDAPSSSTDSWEMAEGLAIDLVDQRNAE